MRKQSIRRLTMIAVLALASMTVAAGCKSDPATPTTGAAPSATPGATPGVTPVAEPSRTPAPQPTRSSKSPPGCLGAVIYLIHARDTGPPWPTPCIAVGGVVQVEGHGPDGFEVSPWSNVSCWYEAAFHECRLIAKGTVTFTITRTDVTRRLTVLVADGSSPPKPSPACIDDRTFTVDASDPGPPWHAECLKVGATVRVVNLGRDGFSVSPSNSVACRNSAGVRECRLLTVGTVRFTIVREEIRPFIVVVIR